jgi:hypothetical protein
MDKTEEEKMARSFVALMDKRGISDREAYFSYLRDQKQKKYEVAEARMEEAKDEMAVLGKLIEGAL